MEKNNRFYEWTKRLIIFLLKMIWKIFLICLWGILRLAEIICAQFAIWVKSLIN